VAFHGGSSAVCGGRVIIFYFFVARFSFGVYYFIEGLITPLNKTMNYWQSINRRVSDGESTFAPLKM